MVRCIWLVLSCTVLWAQIESGFHLTARPWKPLATSKARYTSKLQDSTGAIIDPFFKAEHQYATPYFAYAVGALVDAGRAKELLPYGIKAMEHATDCFGAVSRLSLNSFIAVLTGALPLYEKVLKSWRSTADGFTSEAGTLKGKLWIGKTSAGGWGDTLDLDGDGKPELRLSMPWHFIANGRITVVEADRRVQLTAGARTIVLAKYVPQEIR